MMIWELTKKGISRSRAVLQHMPESVSHSSQQEPLSPEKGVKIDGFLWMKKNADRY